MTEPKKTRGVRVRRKDLEVFRDGKKRHTFQVRAVDPPERYYVNFVIVHKDQTPTYRVPAEKRPIELECFKGGSGAGTEVVFKEGDEEAPEYYPTIIGTYPDGCRRRIRADKIICNSTHKGHGEIRVILPPPKKLPALGGQLVAWAFLVGSFAMMAASVYAFANEAFATM